MDIKKLNEILAQKDTNKILNDFRIAGYKDMTRDATLKEFNLVDIAKSEICEETEYHESLKFGFYATLHNGIRNLSNHEIIWLQVDKIDLKKGIAIPNKSYIYFYKEQNNNDNLY